MKKTSSQIVLALFIFFPLFAISANAQFKRYFDANKKGLPHYIQKGPYVLEVETKADFRATGNSANIVWDGDTPRLLTATERAERDTRQQLDSMSVLSKLELVRALRSLNLWKTVKALIKSNEDFEDDWNSSNTIDTTDAVFQVGFAMTSINMDQVKLKIIEARKINK